MAKIAVLGHGTVGTGVAEILWEKAALLQSRSGQPLELGYVVDIKEVPDVPYKDKFTKNFADVLADPDVTVVAEAVGGIEPVFTFLKQSLAAGKHVVTANKQLVAEKGAELLKLAKEHNVNFMFEASVGGGIPIIRPLHQCLAANNIVSIAGILNGTSNFILTKMKNENAPFGEVLAEAQRLGYAEADPSADVDGLDTGRKICILASLAYGNHVYPDQISITGIRGIAAEDVELADQLDGSIKLIGYAQPCGDKVGVFVAPMMIPNDQLISGVNDVYNAVEFRGDSVDNVLLYGRGAGKAPTASAMVADIIDCIRRGGTVESLSWIDSGKNVVAELSELEFAQMVRFEGTADDVREILGDRCMIVREENGFTGLILKKCSLGAADALFAKLAVKGKLLSAIRVLEG